MLHTTSGNSLESAPCRRGRKAKKGVATLALSAKGGGKIKELVDLCIVVPTDRTDRAQEIQMNIQHAICESIDEEVFKDE